MNCSVLFCSEKEEDRAQTMIGCCHLSNPLQMLRLLGKEVMQGDAESVFQAIILG